MIALAEPRDPRLASAPGEPLIIAAIQGLARTAGPGLRRELWLVLEGPDSGSRPAGAVCRTENGVLATAIGESPAREAAEFLAMLGGQGRLTGTVDSRLARLLPGDWRRFPTLVYSGPLPEEVPLCPPSAMGLVDCNIAAGVVPKAAREELYAELHLRVRRGAARIFLVSDRNGKPAAGACTLLGEGYAVVGYLACVPRQRGRGYGAAALLAAVRGAMEQRLVPVLACREELVPFYTRRGFVLSGEIWEMTETARPMGEYGGNNGTASRSEGNQKSRRLRALDESAKPDGHFFQDPGCHEADPGQQKKEAEA